MAIEKIKLPDGSEVSLSEWLHWPLFSTIEGQGAINSAVDPLGLGNGISVDLLMFTYVAGQTVPQAGVVPSPGRMATDSDTNQVARARINHDEAMIVFSMTYEIFALTDDTAIPNLPNDVGALAPVFTGDNLRRMQRDCMYELYVGAGIKKPQARAPLSYYGQGIGAPAWGSGDELNTAAQVINFTYGTAGYVSPLNQRRWQLPVYIHPDRVMKTRLSSPVGQIVGLSQSWQFKGYLDGLKKRPVA
jgi:hypothetical protein